MDISDYYLPLHLLTLTFVAWNIIRADHVAFTWVRGKIDTLNKDTVRFYHRNVWIGLIGMILTGLLMFWPMREYLLSRPQFYLKMAFVFTLLVNGFVIGRLQEVATKKRFKELTTKEKLPLFISGAVSSIAWIGAGVAALFLVEEF